MTRLAVFSTHPIQYQVPIWRALTKIPDLEVVVHYLSDTSVRGAVDADFGVAVAWDTPLLEGYPHEFVARAERVEVGRTLQLPGAAALLREGAFDAVLVAGYAHAFEWQVLVAARRLGLATVMRGEFSDRAADRRSWYRRASRDLALRGVYSFVDAFGYVGADARSHLQRLGVADERMFFSPYCVDSTHFVSLAAHTDRASARAALGLAPGDVAALFSGKLIERKGVDVLLAAARRLVTAGRRVRFLLVGDGPLRGDIEAAARQLPEGTVHLAGFVNQSALGPRFAAADMFVLPSRHETWGLVVNEAMYFGLPVVVSDAVGCVRDLVLDGETGYVARNEDADAFAAAIDRLAADPVRARAMGERGRQRVTLYSVEASAAGLSDAVQFAVQRRRAGPRRATAVAAIP